jgi:hypothetical protein
VGWLKLGIRLERIDPGNIARRSGWVERDNQDGDFRSQRNDDRRAASQRQGFVFGARQSG